MSRILVPEPMRRRAEGAADLDGKPVPDPRAAARNLGRLLEARGIYHEVADYRLEFLSWGRTGCLDGAAEAQSSLRLQKIVPSQPLAQELAGLPG